MEVDSASGLMTSVDRDAAMMQFRQRVEAMIVQYRTLHPGAVFEKEDNYASDLLQLHLHADALMRRLRARCPDRQWVEYDCATVLMLLLRNEEAGQILMAALARFGPNAWVLYMLAIAAMLVGLQDGAVAFVRQAIASDPAALLPRQALFDFLLYHERTTPEDLLAAARDSAALLPRSVQPLFNNTRAPDRKLTIGLLGGHFRADAPGWVTVRGIENLDRAQFDVICLSNIPLRDDPVTHRFRFRSQWLEVCAMDNLALVATARERGIDILLDIGGQGTSGRLSACAHRLAPVQITWAGGKEGTAGMPEMDWFITDWWHTPPEFEAHFTERLLYLPGSYVCYSPPPYAPDVVPLPTLANGHVTFGCFHELVKINAGVIDTWSVILRRVPTARLILKANGLHDRQTIDRMRAVFVANGIDPGRLELRSSSSHRRYMAEWCEIDVALAPFPHSGGVTTCEALWMGVPSIALAGDFFAGRHSSGHMRNVGLADWIAGSVPDYIEMAVARAADVPALAALRAGLRERMRHSPLCDGPRFGRNLGAALRHAWRVWCDEERLAA
ncbi:hypothetical protein [Rhodopila sp.]|uniref:O-linked N-acetylglucosamine transferase, SPINDLY family protein n=1 Tax=Rhodopila sp. TaxID=2480087 RepID=UPI003D09A7E8